MLSGIERSICKFDPRSREVKVTKWPNIWLWFAYLVMILDALGGSDAY